MSPCQTVPVPPFLAIHRATVLWATQIRRARSHLWSSATEAPA